MAGGLTSAHGATCQLETSAAMIFSIAGKINRKITVVARLGVTVSQCCPRHDSAGQTSSSQAPARTLVTVTPGGGSVMGGGAAQLS